MDYFENLFFVVDKEDTENGFTVRLSCNPSHPVYQAHFPGNPITPGACLLQTACRQLQDSVGRPVYLKSSKNIKYLNVLIPAEGKTVRLDFSHLMETDTEYKAQVVIADETTVYSKMSLLFSYDPV